MCIVRLCTSIFGRMKRTTLTLTLTLTLTTLNLTLNLILTLTLILTHTLTLALTNPKAFRVSSLVFCIIHLRTCFHIRHAEV